MTIFVDTNILVRLMTNDVVMLSEKAAKLVQRCGSREIIVSDVVLAELFFVLEFHAQYRLSRPVIVTLFEDIIVPTPQFRISSESNSAIKLYKECPKLDFTDCVLAVSAGMQNTNLLSLDKELIKVLG